MKIVELLAQIRADGAKKARDEIRSVGKEGTRTSQNIQGANATIAKSYGALAKKVAVFAGTIYSVKQAKDMITQITFMAARYETLGTVLNNVGSNIGLNAEQMENLEDGVRSMGITMNSARSSVISMAQANLDLTKSAELARVAQDAAVIAGIDSSQALNRIVYGLKSAQVEVLRTMGINVNFQRSYRRLAQELDKSVESLTEAEKAQARQNAVMEAGKRITGSYEAAMTTAGKKVTSLARHSEDLQNKLGALFTPAFGIIVDEITESLKGMNSELDSMADGRIDEAADSTAKMTAAMYDLFVNVIGASTIEGIQTLGVGLTQLAMVMTGDFAGAAEIGRAQMQEWIETFKEFDSARKRASEVTITTVLPTGVDEFGIQQFETITQTFHETQTAAIETAKAAAEGFAKLKALADGTRSALDRIERDNTDAGQKMLNSLQRRAALIGATTQLQKTEVELTSGKLKGLRELNQLDREQLSLRIQTTAATIDALNEQEKTPKIQQRILELQKEQHTAAAQLALLEEGSTIALEKKLLALSKEIDLRAKVKQINERADPSIARDRDLGVVADLHARGEIGDRAAAQAERDIIERYNNQAAALQKLTMAQQAYLTNRRMSLDLESAQLEGALGNRHITELQYLHERDEMTRKYIVAKQEEIEMLKAAGPAQALAVQKATVELQILENQLGRVAKKFNQVFENNMTDAFTSIIDGSKSASDAFKDMADAIIDDMARIAARQAAMAIMGGTGGQAGAQGGIGGFIASLFADGGIMTNRGPVPLKRYSTGGIADSTQLAMYGEGSTPEAYVPLPDGRTIPVTMQGGGGKVVVNITHVGGGDTRDSVTERRTGDGGRELDIIIEQVEGAMGGRIARGTGLAPVLEGQYGLNRAPGAG